jgi:SUMO ligase MMS21 Smc5/6 complex component
MWREMDKDNVSAEDKLNQLLDVLSSEQIGQNELVERYKEFCSL